MLRTSENELHTDNTGAPDPAGEFNADDNDRLWFDVWYKTVGQHFNPAQVLRDHAPDKIISHYGRGENIQCPNFENHSAADKDVVCWVSEVQRFGGFQIRCRAASCIKLDELSQLQKILADGLFDRGLLENPKYITPWKAPEPLKPASASTAKQAGAKDDARTEAKAGKKANEKPKEKTTDEKTKSDSGPAYQKEIDKLHPKSKSQDISDAAKSVLKAELDDWTHNEAFESMKDKLETTKGLLTTIFTKARRALDAEKPEGKTEYDPQGRVIAPYEGDAPDFHEAVGWCVAAIKEKNRKDGRPTICHVSGSPMHLKRDEETGRFILETMSYASLWSETCNLVTFVRKGDKGNGRREKVSEDYTKHIFEQAEKYLPPAPEIIYAPKFTKTGKLIQKPGYHFDKAAGLNHFLYLAELKVPTISDSPSEAQAKASWNWIDTELLGGFPYCDTDLNGNETKQAGKAHALAMLLTPFAREMIDDQTPMFYVTKPQPGTGGTLCASIPMMLFDGGDVEYINYTDSEAEMGKLLVAAMLKGLGYFFFDDVEDLNNRYIIRSITGEVVTGRELQYTRTVSVKNKFLWLGAGNNTDVGEEMERRICWIRLNAKTSNVKNRTFRHADLKKFIRENRGLAIYHVLTLIQFWIQKGKPKFTERGLPSFEDWAAKVGGILQVCGVTGFLDTAKPVALDMGSSADIELQHMWLEKKGIIILDKDGSGRNQLTAKELFDFADCEQLVILKGRNPDEKRANFDKSLRKLIGRAFMFDKKEYEVKAENGAKGAVFWIAPLGNS